MTTSTSRRCRRLLTWLIVALVAAPAAARADNAEEARAHVARATRAHKEGRYDEARVELEAAYALAPRSDLLYALGQIHAKLGHCRDAEAYFRKKHALAGVESLDISLVKPDAEWTADVPAHAKYRPVESILKPCGCFSFGTLPTTVSVPVAGSTLKAASVLDVRSEA